MFRLGARNLRRPKKRRRTPAANQTRGSYRGGMTALVLHDDSFWPMGSDKRREGRLLRQRDEVADDADGDVVAVAADGEAEAAGVLAAALVT